jgi:hypothetical protein
MLKVLVNIGKQKPDFVTKIRRQKVLHHRHIWEIITITDNGFHQHLFPIKKIKMFSAFHIQEELTDQA